MKNVKRLFVTLILVVLANLMVQVPAYAKPHFNKHDVLFLKKGKSKTVKIKGLSKKQQKKKWKFECSDKRVATIKQKGKYGFTIKAKKIDGFVCIRAKQSKTTIYLWVVVDNGKTMVGGLESALTRGWEIDGGNQHTKYERMFYWTTYFGEGHSPEATLRLVRKSELPHKMTVPPEYGAKNNIVYGFKEEWGDLKDVNGYVYKPLDINAETYGDRRAVIGLDEDFKPIYPIGVNNPILKNNR